MFSKTKMEVSNVCMVDKVCYAQQTASTAPVYLNRILQNNDKGCLTRSSSITTTLEEDECVGNQTRTRQLGVSLNPSTNSWMVSWERNGIYYSKSFPIIGNSSHQAHYEAIHFYSAKILESEQDRANKPLQNLSLPYNINNIKNTSKTYTVPYASQGFIPSNVPYPLYLHFNKNINKLNAIHLHSNGKVSRTEGNSTKPSQNNKSQQTDPILPNGNITKSPHPTQSIPQKKPVYEIPDILPPEIKANKTPQPLDLLKPTTDLNNQTADVIGKDVSEPLKTKLSTFTSDLRQYYIQQSKLFPKVRGVWFNSTPNRMGWVGQAYKKCKRIEKIFSVSRHGFEQARELAISFRNSQKPEYKPTKGASAKNTDPPQKTPAILERATEIDRLETSLQSPSIKNSLVRMNSIEAQELETLDPQTESSDNFDDKDNWFKSNKTTAQQGNESLEFFGDVESVVSTKKALDKSTRKSKTQYFNKFLNEIESLLRLKISYPFIPPLVICFQSLELHRKVLANDSNFDEYNSLLGHYYDMGNIMPSELPIGELVVLLSFVTRKKRKEHEKGDYVEEPMPEYPLPEDTHTSLLNLIKL